MHIGKNIKQFRTSLNMSQGELAQKLFVTRQTISNYETGKSQPTIEILQALASIFECSLEDLLYGKKKEASINRWLIVLGVILGVVIFHSYLSKVIEEWTSATYHVSAYAYLLVPIICPLLFSVSAYAIVEILKAKQTKLPKVPYNKYLRLILLLVLGIYMAVILVYPTAMAMDSLRFLGNVDPYVDF